MPSIINGAFIRDDMTSKAMGGTELLAHRLIDNVPKKHLRDWQIHISRLAEIDKTKRQLLWVHDLATDPAVAHLKDGGWDKFERIIFVSHWQQEMYNIYLGVPYHKGVVIHNAIEPIEDHEKPKDDKIRLIYTSTPHRGLDILYPVFDALCKTYDNIELDVYSSFKLYGWDSRDEQYKGLFDKLKQHPKINYHGSVSNEKIREALKKSNIFAYPSTWQETSCLCLIEAMSAGLTCVHSSLAALSETSMMQTMMYTYSDDVTHHANILYANLHSAIALQNNPDLKTLNFYSKSLADAKYNTNRFASQWQGLLKSS